MLIVALSLRILWSALVPVAPISDGGAYDAFARTLVEFGVYGWTQDQPTAYWPVGTSAVYAVFYSLFGFSYVPIVLFNIALSTAIVALTIRLGNEFFSPAGIIAGWIMAIWPSEVAYVTLLASELPFTGLVLAGFAAWFGKFRSSLVRGVAGGVAFGAAAYFRPVSLLLPAVLYVSSGMVQRKWRAGLFPAIVATIVIGIAVAPWCARNATVFGHFVFSTNGGANLWMGNNPNSGGSYTQLPASVAELDEYERDRVLGGEAKRYILSEPVGFLLRTASKLVQLHLGETIAVTWNSVGIERRFGERAILPLKLITQAFWTACLLLGLAGIAVIAKAHGARVALLNPVSSIWLYFSAVYAVTVTQDRYHFPSHPLIAILASVAIVALATKLGRRWKSPKPPGENSMNGR